MKSLRTAALPAKYERHKYAIRRQGQQWSWAVIRAIFIVGFSFVILYPVLNMITRAFMEPQDFYDNSVMWLPRHSTMANVKLVTQAIGYWGAFRNSLWSSIAATALQLCACIFAGYAFARYSFPLKRLMFALVILTLIVPPQLTMTSSYMFFNDFDVFNLIKALRGSRGLLDTQWPMMLMSATGTGIRNGLFIYMFRQFFISMPKETEEAAMVDGAGHFRTFSSVMLPGAVTVIVTVALFSFVWQWNDVFFTNLYNRSFPNLPNSLSQMDFSHYFSLYPEYNGFLPYDPILVKNLKSTAAILVVAPLILLFVVMQRYFVESVERSGVVG